MPRSSRCSSPCGCPTRLDLATARGQYVEGWSGGVKAAGFLDEEGIPKSSHTETYAAVTLHIDTRRWAGVPFYLRTGKRLGRRVTEVAVVFKPAPHQPFSVTATEDLSPNTLVIRVQPDEGMTLRFGSKVPGTAMEIRDVNMDFAYGGTFTEASPEAYERLILDVLLGDPPLFPRHEEVEESWKILDPILENWERKGKPDTYDSGTWGPASADKMLARDGRTGDAWRRPLPRLEGRLMELTDTSSSEIAAEFMRARTRAGSPVMGMVMTLIIVVDEDGATDALDAAKAASHEHPARVLGVILGDGRGAGTVNAQVGTGGGWAGEVALIRLKGEVVKHPDSVVLPLLLPDSPVAVWWPKDHPKDPAADPIGALSKRRITDAAYVTRGKLKALHAQCAAYSPGNTDLAWTRLTPWRALLASALDQHPAKVTSAEVTAERISPSADLLTAWLGRPAQGARHPAELRRTRAHLGGDGDQGRPDPDRPLRRQARHLQLARASPTGPWRSSARRCPSCWPRSCGTSTRTTCTPRPRGRW